MTMDRTAQAVIGTAALNGYANGLHQALVIDQDHVAVYDNESWMAPVIAWAFIWEGTEPGSLLLNAGCGQRDVFGKDKPVAMVAELLRKLTPVEIYDWLLREKDGETVTLADYIDEEA